MRNFNKKQEKKDKRKVFTRTRRHEIVNKFTKHNPFLTFSLFILFLKKTNTSTFPISLGINHFTGSYGSYCGDKPFYYKTHQKVDLSVLTMTNKQRSEHFRDNRKVRFMKREAA